MLLFRSGCRLFNMGETMSTIQEVFDMYGECGLEFDVKDNEIEYLAVLLPLVAVSEADGQSYRLGMRLL